MCRQKTHQAVEEKRKLFRVGGVKYLSVNIITASLGNVAGCCQVIRIIP